MQMMTSSPQPVMLRMKRQPSAVYDMRPKSDKDDRNNQLYARNESNPAERSQINTVSSSTGGGDNRDVGDPPSFSTSSKKLYPLVEIVNGPSEGHSTAVVACVNAYEPHYTHPNLLKQKRDTDNSTTKKRKKDEEKTNKERCASGIAFYPIDHAKNREFELTGLTIVHATGKQVGENLKFLQSKKVDLFGAKFDFNQQKVDTKQVGLGIQIYNHTSETEANKFRKLLIEGNSPAAFSSEGSARLGEPIVTEVIVKKEKKALSAKKTRPSEQTKLEERGDESLEEGDKKLKVTYQCVYYDDNKEKFQMVIQLEPHSGLKEAMPLFAEFRSPPNWSPEPELIPIASTYNNQNTIVFEPPQMPSGSSVRVKVLAAVSCKSSTSTLESDIFEVKYPWMGRTKRQAVDEPPIISLIEETKKLKPNVDETEDEPTATTSSVASQTAYQWNTPTATATTSAAAARACEVVTNPLKTDKIIFDETELEQFFATFDNDPDYQRIVQRMENENENVSVVDLTNQTMIASMYAETN